MIRSTFVTTLESLPDWPGIERITAESVNRGCYERVAGNQTRHDATIQITVSGRGRCRTADRPWVAIPTNHALVYHASIHPEVCYEVDPHSDHWHFIYINVHGSGTLAQIISLVARMGHVIPFPAHHAALHRLIAYLPEQGSRHRIMGLAEVAQVVHELLTVLAQGCEGRSLPSSELALRALHILSDQWRDPPVMHIVARRLGVSREHLVRSMRTATGLPPGQWLRRHRIQRAADELLVTTASIADVACAAGFASASHFVRLFRTVHGETPSQYRRRRAALAPTPRGR